MTAASRARFAEVVRTEPVDLTTAALLIGVEAEPDLSLDAAESALAALARDVPRGVPGEPATVSAARLAESLHAYQGHRDDYADLRSSLLHEVIRRRRGLPILLSLLWLEVAARVGVGAYPVGLPGHFVVGIGDPDGDHVLVDAYRGGVVISLAEAERLVVETTGMALAPAHLVPAEPVDVLFRVLTNIRAHIAGLPGSLDNLATRLWAVELSLLLPRHPVDLRRERAELLLRLGRYLDAAGEFEVYAEVVEGADPEAAATARSSALVSRARCN